MNFGELVATTQLGKTYIFYVGQAGFIFKSKRGTTIGIDLYLSDCVERFDHFKRLAPKIVHAGELELDYVIATHSHLDHFDIDTMPFLLANGRTNLIAAKDCAVHVNNLQLNKKKVTYMEDGDSIACEDILVEAVFCDHGAATPFAVGIILKIDEYVIYIAGDTALRLDKAEEIAKKGPVDILIAPINGNFGNMDEHDAVTLCEYYLPKIVIPCHYWMFAEHHGDPGIFMEEMKRQLPETRYLIMRMGEYQCLEEIIQ